MMMAAGGHLINLPICCPLPPSHHFCRTQGNPSWGQVCIWNPTANATQLVWGVAVGKGKGGKSQAHLSWGLSTQDCPLLKLLFTRRIYRTAVSCGGETISMVGWNHYVQMQYITECQLLGWGQWGRANILCPPDCAVSWESLVDYCVIPNAGLDGPYVVLFLL